MTKIMLRRFCNLCQIIESSSIRNLRKFSITKIYTAEEQASYKDVFADDFVSIIPIQESSESQKTKSIDEKKNPIVKCKNPQLNFYPGKVFKKFEEILIASKGWHHYKSKGDYFTIYPTPVPEDEEYTAMKTLEFSDMNLDPRLMENMKNLGLTEPTIIQKIAILPLLNGQNTIITAETGCGKTFAYLIPIIEHILKRKQASDKQPYNTPLAVIVTASRELSVQIGIEARKLTRDLGISVKTLYGGRSKALHHNPDISDVDILVGTVGILCKMTTWKIYKLNEVRHTVLDEAHALFHDAYNEKLKAFLKKIKFGFAQSGEQPTASSQLILASATMPQSMPEYLDAFVDRKSLVTATTPNVHRILVPQKFCRVGSMEKPFLLLKLLKTRVARKEPTLVFTKNGTTSDYVAIFLNKMNIKTIPLNGAMLAASRKTKFAEFLRGDAHVLSTTNSAARGLDTGMVDLIINYDFPSDTADYVHRCGRTGRVGGVENGRVINFISQKHEIELTQKIERMARRGRAIPMFDIILQTQDLTIDQEIKMLLNKS